MIEMEKVSFSYYSSAQNANISHIDLTIRDTQCVLLCGRSGCGKTTLIRLINGLIPSFYSGELSGSVLINGKSVQETPPYQLAEHVGSVFQNPRSQFFNIDTDSEMVFGMENLAWTREKMTERLTKTIRDLQIETLSGRRVAALSGGEKQKVAFASIYALSPDIYLLDEPSSNLDTAAIESLRKILVLLKKQGKTIVIAEHRIHYLKDIADRILYMENGKIRQSLTSEQVCNISEADRCNMGLRTMDLSRICIPDRVRKYEKPILEIRNLALAHHDHTVLAGVNLCASPGEIIGIIGHNGAGKSTFSRALCGLHKEMTGTITWNGKRLSAKERLKHCYMVMQEVGYQLFADTVEKECCFGIQSPDYGAAKQAMEQLGIWEYRNAHPSTLSGGQKQRTAVAVSMVCRRNILIFDEPTSGLDYDSMVNVSRLFQTLSAMGKVLFVVTHDYEFLISACTRILHLGDGGIAGDYAMSPKNEEKLRAFFFSS